MRRGLTTLLIDNQPFSGMFFKTGVCNTFQLYLKETLTQEFYCEYFEIFNINFFVEILWWLLLLRGNWRKVTQVKQKCQMSTNLSKMLTCYLIPLYLLKICLLKKLFWKPLTFPWTFGICQNSYSKEKLGTAAFIMCLH